MIPAIVVLKGKNKLKPNHPQKSNTCDKEIITMSRSALTPGPRRFHWCRVRTLGPQPQFRFLDLFAVFLSLLFTSPFFSFSFSKTLSKVATHGSNLIYRSIHSKYPPPFGNFLALTRGGGYLKSSNDF